MGELLIVAALFCFVTAFIDIGGNHSHARWTPYGLALALILGLLGAGISSRNWPNENLEPRSLADKEGK